MFSSVLQEVWCDFDKWKTRCGHPFLRHTRRRPKIDDWLLDHEVDKDMDITDLCMAVGDDFDRLESLMSFTDWDILLGSEIRFWHES